MGKKVFGYTANPGKLGKKMKGTPAYNRVVLQDATAQEIVFPEVHENVVVSVGDKAEIDQRPASGEFVMPDGRTFVFRLGKLTKIILSPEEAFAKMKSYLDDKRKKANPTAAPESRFIGMLNRVKTKTNNPKK